MGNILMTFAPSNVWLNCGMLRQDLIQFRTEDIDEVPKMTRRFVQLLLVVMIMSLEVSIGLSRVMSPIAQAQASPILKSSWPDERLLADQKGTNNNKLGPAPAALRQTEVSTFYLFLPLVINQPASAPILQVLDETNIYRSQYGCPPLTLNQQLVSAAQGHSDDMALNDFFSHTGSDGSSPWQRISSTGYDYTQAAENIAAGHSTAQAVVEGWMNSDGHRANILNCALREIGIGYYNLADDTGAINYHYYWTQVFATPK